MRIRIDQIEHLARVAEREGVQGDLAPLWRRCPEPFASLAGETPPSTAQFDWFWPVLSRLGQRAAVDPDCARALKVLDRLLRPAIMEATMRLAAHRSSGVAEVVDALAGATGASVYAMQAAHAWAAEGRPAEAARSLQNGVDSGALEVSPLVEPGATGGLIWQASSPAFPPSIVVPTVSATGEETVERPLAHPPSRPYLADLPEATVEGGFLVHVPGVGALADGVSYRRRHGLSFRSFFLLSRRPFVAHASLKDDEAIQTVGPATYFGKTAEHGHFIIEGLERLYAHAAAERPPEPPFLVQRLPRPSYRRLLAALQMPTADEDYVIMHADRVRSRRLTLAGIGTQLPAVDADTTRFLGESGRRAAGVAPRSGGAGKRLYLARKSGGRRSITNEPAMRAALEDRGYVTVYLEDLDLVDQIALVADAASVVGVHGSAMINLIWASPGTRVCVLAPTSWRSWAPAHLEMLFGFFGAIGLDATLLECEPAQESAAGLEQFHDDMVVPLTALRRWLGRPTAR